ncbi:MAG: methyltransferase domain-containing protein [Pseudomonadota bacterium]
MTDNPSLDAAYALKGKDAVRDLYETWAETYDSGFADDQGYQLPKEVAVAYAEAGGTGPVLDVGAGTGLGAPELIAKGIDVIDGVDLSPEMLAVAAKKGLYRNLIEADITKPLPGNPNYAGIVSAGTFTLGHVGVDGLKALVDGAAPRTLFVISVNAKHYESAGFAAYLAASADHTTDLTFKEVKIYNERADPAHQDDVARLLIFRIT